MKTKQIPLSRGLFATVDAADFDWLNQWKWSALRTSSKGGEKFYAVRMQKKGEYVEKPKMILMHRVIAGSEGRKSTDHRDLDTLNNTRTNLRPCTQAQNSLNHKGHCDRVSRFKGVSLHRQTGKFVADFRGKYIGIFKTEELAAAAYDRAAIEYSPSYALPNMGV